MIVAVIGFLGTAVTGAVCSVLAVDGTTGQEALIMTGVGLFWIIVISVSAIVCLKRGIR